MTDSRTWIENRDEHIFAREFATNLRQIWTDFFSFATYFVAFTTSTYTGEHLLALPNIAASTSEFSNGWQRLTISARWQFQPFLCFGTNLFIVRTKQCVGSCEYQLVRNGRLLRRVEQKSLTRFGFPQSCDRSDSKLQIRIWIACNFLQHLLRWYVAEISDGHSGCGCFLGVFHRKDLLYQLPFVFLGQQSCCLNRRRVGRNGSQHCLQIFILPWSSKSLGDLEISR